MIIRHPLLRPAGIVRFAAYHSPRASQVTSAIRNSVIKHPARRYSSTSSPKPSTATSIQDSVSPLVSLTNELDRIAPGFEIEAEDVEILRGPSEFYDVLKVKILNAKHRIYLSTLYIGKTEHELISTIRLALTNNASLRVSILTDALRGTRETPEPTTASLLAPLIAEFGSERVQIRMYHTPNLTGLRKRLIPKRINEGWGLQHMKLYGIDDEIILSGANLSHDYFTNRLDRYHLFRSADLTNFYHHIHATVSSISFDIQPSDAPAGYTMSWPSEAKIVSPLDDPTAYRAHATALLKPLIVPDADRSSPLPSSTHSKGDKGVRATKVYPIFQFTPLFNISSRLSTSDASTELPALISLLTMLATSNMPTHTTFTAGYFNPSASLVSLLLASQTSSSPTTKSPKRDVEDSLPFTRSPSTTTVISASPYANGFYGSKGISGLLPPAYTLLCKRFLEEVTRRGLTNSVRLLEWRRGTVGVEGGWTYHAKGVWVTFLDGARSGGAQPGETVQGPSVTLVGSSNYTQRSYTLDLEANAMVVTGDAGLQRRLREEEDWLRKDAREVDLDEYRSTERRVGIHVRVAMWITKMVGGAL